jgi:type VI secretion system protein VasG
VPKPDDSLKGELTTLTDQLAKLQGDNPLVYYCVTGQTVSEVISAWTGIPMGKMLRDEIATVMKLQSLMEERVIGQSHALAEITKRIRTARAGLEDPSKPKGVFLLVGTSGVGKTETALALADILYGGERNIITINMSEYQQDYAVSNLIGSAKGLVGYGEGGVLTEAVRRRPHSVVLLDEIEKAHPRVFELFFQVFDKGVLNDSTGREVDFKNSIIILTSNAGTDTIMQAWQQTGGQVSGGQLIEALRPELQNIFKPAFLGRLSIIPFFPISDQILKRIVELKLNKVKKRIEQNHRAQFVYAPEVIEAIAQRCTEVESGARSVDNILSGALLPEISDAVLARMGSGHPIQSIGVSVGENGSFKYEVV